MTRLGTHEANTKYGTDIMSLPANEDLKAAASSTREESKNITKAEEPNPTNNEESG